MDDSQLAPLDQPGDGDARHRLEEHRREAEHVAFGQGVAIDQLLAELLQPGPAVEKPRLELRPLRPAVVAAQIRGRVVRQLGKRDLTEQPVAKAGQHVGDDSGDLIEHLDAEVMGEIDVQVADIGVYGRAELALGQCGELAQREGRSNPFGKWHVYKCDTH
jgi:hypothetical protein